MSYYRRPSLYNLQQNTHNPNNQNNPNLSSHYRPTTRPKSIHYNSEKHEKQNQEYVYKTTTHLTKPQRSRHNTTLHNSVNSKQLPRISPVKSTSLLRTSSHINARRTNTDHTSISNTQHPIRTQSFAPLS